MRPSALCPVLASADNADDLVARVSQVPGDGAVGESTRDHAGDPSERRPLRAPAFFARRASPVLEDVDLVTLVLAGGHVLQVAQVGICSVAVLVVGLLVRRTRADERQQYEQVHLAALLLVPLVERNMRIAVPIVVRGPNPCTRASDATRHAPDPTAIGHFVEALKAWNLPPHFGVLHG